MAVAHEIASRLTDPARLAAAIEAARRESSYPHSVLWVPHSVAQGAAGLALMCSCVDACFPGRDWDRRAHEFLSTATYAAEGTPLLPAGALSGLAGLAFLTCALSRDGVRYQRLLGTLEDAVLPDAIALADAVCSRAAGVAMGEYDAVSGLAGLCAALLPRRDRAQIGESVRDMLAALVHICGQDQSMPRWHTPHQLIPDETTAAQFPRGFLNCGLAHGIPGPIAALAVALRNGIEVDGQRDALRAACGWLIAHRADDRWGINWPIAVPVGYEEARDGTLPPSRAAWCYGSPGVARALWLAGDALDDSGICELAVRAMAAVYDRPVEERRIESPTFCHGVAGLLQITLRFAHDTRLPMFTDAAATLASQLLEAHEGGCTLGYRSVEPGGKRIDQAGLLDGAPGVAMVLLAAATDVEPTWDRIFLLS